MSADDYKQAGFKLSVQMSQTEIDRAENDIRFAYFGGVDESTELYSAALMNLVFLLLLQRNTSVTRSGAKQKTSPQSVSVSDAALIREQAKAAAMYYKAWRTDAVSEYTLGAVTDICGLYFRTYLFG